MKGVTEMANRKIRDSQARLLPMVIIVDRSENDWGIVLAIRKIRDRAVNRPAMGIFLLTCFSLLNILRTGENCWPKTGDFLMAIQSC